MKRQPNRSRRREQGTALLESVIALCILFFAFFALLQIYQWCVAKIFCQYSAYYAGKGMALGYRVPIVLRSARVAAIGISGRNQTNAAHGTLQDERANAELYMTTGDRSGVWYEYWGPLYTSDGPELTMGGNWRDYGSQDNRLVDTTIRLKDAPLLHPNLARPLGIGKTPEPDATVTSYNYAKILLEE